MLRSCIKGFLRAKKLWVNPPKAERAKPSLSSDYNLLFKNKIGERSLDIHRFRRGFEREHKFGRPYPTNFPETYSDIRKCFYTFPSMNVTPQAFYAAWVIGVPEDPEGGGDGGTTPQPKPISNPYIDSELAGLATAPQDDLDAVNALSSWCQNAAADSDLVSFLEDEGKILKSPDRQQIATDIYESKGMKDIIQTRGFDVYIPSYV